MIEENFQEIATMAALAMEAMVVIILIAASVKAFIKSIPLLFSTTINGEKRRDMFIGFGTAIVLALEFALAADIVRSAIAPTWEAIGKLAAIAAIRTILNFSLSRDIEQLMRETGDKID